MLDHYFGARLTGSSGQELRAFARVLDSLANDLTHSDSMGRVKALGCVQALVLLTRLIQEIEAT